ncbi:hypothetical protein J1605_002195 [Eschrichtius robustus]|uniref:Uncharacterized protein n=1 Tax=Eschrichtius robustus TaxID=9764 RepID=A0AB34HWF7_ESCRO|nr:hypothetical protein J1605_002195 [Eschrichtius robustus]
MQWTRPLRLSAHPSVLCVMVRAYYKRLQGPGLTSPCESESARLRVRASRPCPRRYGHLECIGLRGAPLEQLGPYPDLSVGRLCFPPAVVAAFVLAGKTEARALECRPHPQAPRPQLAASPPGAVGLRDRAQADTLTGGRSAAVRPL